ncbi:MAG: nucleoside triphosphate pyrophosphohydrolase, partial [Woeseia sp.]|nr:nucleoside triphosphate pyrophosphohydrolase [Woeseia sp.]MBT8097354.1 nucleoside triphosphate pyrophosphohydrolase [Woeseia sp.]NNE61450.1 nucleoside triphosphate pyrophosphohydrolase [Woeseia sp.]NNL55277.1 nucleoside triphosphate pyrophosphohydrolase [Woeseia sp.]
PYTVEEAFEVADAISREDWQALRDELGDVLFQVVFHAQMADEAGYFTFDDVVNGICEKMVRRHPHVFGSAEEQRRGPETGSWERIKAAERAGGTKGASSALDGVALALPALKRATKLGKRAAAVGFDWDDSGGPLAKIHEELGELAEAGASKDRQAEHDEMGDLLLSVANLSRHLKIDAEQALSDANRRFEARFRELESRLLDSGRALPDCTLEELEAAWQAAKARLAARKGL